MCWCCQLVDLIQIRLKGMHQIIEFVSVHVVLIHDKWRFVWACRLTSILRLRPDRQMCVRIGASV